MRVSTSRSEQQAGKVRKCFETYLVHCKAYRFEMHGNSYDEQEEAIDKQY
jgi:hypothetical protein